jgi:Holliday junction resolvase
MRRAAAVDANQSDIVAALRKVGASVQPLHAVGSGVPDLLVGRAGMNILLECKDGAKKPSDRKLTPSQVEWHANWRGQVCVVSSVAEALDALANGVALIPFKGVVR